MGIQGLTKLIGDNAPAAIKENKLESYFGRKIAIDASMSIYQFLIAVRSSGEMLANEAGEVTSHLQGLWNRTIRMMESGIKPVYVFDGKPPKLKSGELAKRLDRRKDAQEDLEKSKEAGDQEGVEKYSKRIVRVTSVHNDDAKRLMHLMGVPVVQAPCEAESQCAALTKAAKVFATASEDMDSLTYGSDVLVRHLTFSDARKLPLLEINLKTVLDKLGLDMDQFIDLCILCGCDYCDSIKGIGPAKALGLIKKHGNMEAALESLKDTKYEIPENFPYQDARDLFKNPDVTDPETIDLKWTECDEAGLKQFLCVEKGFDEKRVATGIDKLKKSKHAAAQGRLENFFGPVTVVKRKADGPASKDAKKGKTAGRGRGGGRPK